ncbi:hypothetical protein AWZ03_014851 [Drosophila navojoa]|uniref:Uncharacterized protein n=1 Tax=Drosophila navojoa TaxID=7232 RepID=A0A484APG9_DRONA|nr:hypothetical protein AWZ03_014851 [Drosophila navojoa]
MKLKYNNSLPNVRAYARPYQFHNLVELMHKDRERLRHQPRPNRTRFMAMDDAGGDEEYCMDACQGQAQPEHGHTFLVQPGHAECVVKRGIALGKRGAAPAIQGRAAAAARSPQVLLGSLQDDGSRLTAIVAIGVSQQIDTGASSSFISEKLAERFGEAGVVRATQRRIRLADGTISLGNQQIQIPLLILPGVIDDLVLGWDFLFSMGTTLECGDLALKIGPINPNPRHQLEAKLSTTKRLLITKNRFMWIRRKGTNKTKKQRYFRRRKDRRNVVADALLGSF